MSRAGQGAYSQGAPYLEWETDLPKIQAMSCSQGMYKMPRDEGEQTVDSVGGGGERREESL